MADVKHFQILIQNQTHEAKPRFHARPTNDQPILLKTAKNWGFELGKGNVTNWKMRCQSKGQVQGW